MHIRSVIALGVFIVAAPANAQQVVDSAYRPPIPTHPAYPTGRGPVIVVDAAHHNFHTVDGRYLPFARLLQSDGYRVRSGLTRYDSSSLASIDVLVIANALNAANVSGQNWVLPIQPAFDAHEVREIAAWVRRGGALWLIADHMPFAGAIEELGRSVGIIWLDGFAVRENQQADTRTHDFPITFTRSSGALGDAPVTDGSDGTRIDSVTTFTGSAFRIDAARVGKAWPVLTFTGPTRVWLPSIAWQFGDSVPRTSGDGFLQGAVLWVGKGRVAAFGEAAMFSAQRKGPDRSPMGMNAPEAGQNAQLARNIARWLSSRP